ncbi:uncharacterized protein TNCV_3235041 [Trichonephila clavipes]|nr:uncharacterized protein TNCV_3235041 [Trichonephila clavipes]
MDLEILNHGQVTSTSSELETPSPNFQTTPIGGHLSFDIFNVHHSPTWQVFSASRAANWSHCSLYPASNQRAVTVKTLRKSSIQTKHRSHASRIPSTIQSPSCHLAECKTPLSSCPSSKTCPDMGLRTVLTVQKPKKATSVQLSLTHSLYPILMEITLGWLEQ